MSRLRQVDGRDLDPRSLAFTSFANLLEARRDDDRIFLSFYERGRKFRDLTFSEFHRQTILHAKALENRGVRESHRVLLLTGNSLDSFFLMSALLFLRAIVLPVDPNESPDYVSRIATFAKASLVVAPEDWCERLRSSGLSIVSMTGIRTSADEAMPVESGSSTPIADASLDADCSLFFTSGTTGDAKGVLQSLGSAFANAEGTKRSGQLSLSDVLISCLPLYHVNAFNFSLLLPLYIGCRIVYQSSFVPNFLSVARDENATVASLSPPILRLLLKDPREQQPLPSMRYVLSASSALHRADLLGMQDRFDIRVNQAYGLSETINFTLMTPPDLSEDEYHAVTTSGELPPAGIPVWGNEVRLLNEVGEEIQTPEAPGEIVVRGWSILRGYLDNPTATTYAFSGDFFHTGDVAYYKDIGSRRYYFLCGRLKETVKRSGQQIYLSEIDQAAREIGLENACAVGFTNVHTEEEIGLFLVRGEDDPRTHEALLSELQSKLHYAKCPKVIVEGPSIPKTAVGKIRRSELRSAFDAFRETRFRHV